MLVLTRRVGEEILIGDDIVIRVKEIKRGQVRIGVHAPRDLLISRAELRDVHPLDPVEPVPDDAESFSSSSFDPKTAP